MRGSGKGARLFGVGLRGMPFGFGKEACRCKGDMDRRISHPWLKRLPRTSLCAVHIPLAAPRFASLEIAASTGGAAAR